MTETSTSPSADPGPQLPDLTGQRVLVTGGSGFIGRSLVTALLAAGAAVRVLDRRATGREGVEDVVGDLTDPAARSEAVTSDLDGVVHLAAVTSVLRSKDDPVGTHALNVEATAGLLELARTRGVHRFVLASTNAVVGDVEPGERIDESSPLRPKTPYGATKAAGEMLLSAYSSSYGIAGAALRFTNVYGPGMAEKDSFVPRMMRVASDPSSGPVRVYGDGGQRRDLVYVGDVVQAVLLAWTTGHVGPLTIGGGRSVSVLEMVEAVGAATGVDLPVEHVAAQPGEMREVVVDISRARELGFEPRTTLREGLTAVWHEFSGRDA